MLLALSVSTIAASAALIAARDVVRARREAQACGRLLVETARVLNVQVGRLAPCLGAPVGAVASWPWRGVPRRHRQDVRQLARQAVVLRQHMPAPTALHLLELRRRAADSLAEGLRRMAATDGSAARAAGSKAESRLIRGVVITSR